MTTTFFYGNNNSNKPCWKQQRITPCIQLVVLFLLLLTSSATATAAAAASASAAVIGKEEEEETTISSNIPTRYNNNNDNNNNNNNVQSNQKGFKLPLPPIMIHSSSTSSSSTTTSTKKQEGENAAKKHNEEEEDEEEKKDSTTTTKATTKATTTTTTTKLPHIIMIVMDDLGSNDLGFHTTGIQTPTCDSLIRQGLYLDNYYVLPSCSPTRSALLSGRYPLHTGVHDWIPSKSTAGLPLNDETLPTMLQNANYHTHAIGKWHLGHSSWEQTPTFRGFQSFYGFYLGGQDYYQHYENGGYDLRYDKQEYCGSNCSQIVDERGNYSTHIFTREAIRIIQEYNASTSTPTKRNNEKQPTTNQQQQEEEEETSSSSSLFVYLAYQAVHDPAEVPEKYINMYKNKTNWTTQRKIYAGMLSAADEGIYNVTIALKEYGLWDNTLIIFTTDNGGPTTTCAIQGSSNYPRRGGKCSIWEGGTTGDGFVSGPAMRYLNWSIQTRFSNLMHVVDWFPTLAELVNVIPNGNPLDGVSQLSGFQQQQQTDNNNIIPQATMMTTNTNTNINTSNAVSANVAIDPFPPARRELFVGYAHPSGGRDWYGPALRYGRWKFIQGVSGGPDNLNSNPPGTKTPAPGGGGGDGVNGSSYLLYDLLVDKEELQNLAPFYPRIVQRLANKLRYYQRTYVPPQPNDDSSCPWTGLVNTTVGPTW